MPNRWFLSTPGLLLACTGPSAPVPEGASLAHPGYAAATAVLEAAAARDTAYSAELVLVLSPSLDTAGPVDAKAAAFAAPSNLFLLLTGDSTVVSTAVAQALQQRSTVVLAASLASVQGPDRYSVRVEEIRSRESCGSGTIGQPDPSTRMCVKGYRAVYTVTVAASSRGYRATRLSLDSLSPLAF